MKSPYRFRSLALAVLLAASAGSAGSAGDPPKTSQGPQFGPHDGVVAKTKHHCFETVFAPGDVSVYMFDAEMAPLLMQRVKTVCTLTLQGSSPKEVPLTLATPGKDEKTLFFCPMHPNVAQTMPGKCEACGGMELIPQDCLRGPIDLTKSSPGNVKATITIKGMKGEESEATYTVAWAAPSKK